MLVQVKRKGAREGCPARSFCGWQAGIRTGGEHGRARILRVEPERIRRALDEDTVVVVAGFQGVDDCGDITTIGRGGSDTTAVALAAALHADVCRIYTDVRGVFSADPRVVGDIRDINRRLGITVIIITHQMNVVEDICNRVAILENGEVVEEGEVSEVFSRPKSAAAQRMVFPDSDNELLSAESGERVIRLVFNGAEAAGQPIIAKMAIDEHIAASILYASTKSIGSKLYGKIPVSVQFPFAAADKMPRGDLRPYWPFICRIIMARF